MREQGIRTTFHYVPLHSSDGGRRFAARPTECPVSSDVSGRLMRLPFFNTLTEDERRPGRGHVLRRRGRRRRRERRRSQRAGSASIEQPDYWWYTRPVGAAARPRWATSSATPRGCSTSAAPTARA